jgi:ankyrin repeat protein
MDDFLLKEYSAEIGDDKPIVIPSKPKLSETGRRLLGHIKANKIYEVGTLLRNKPEVAIEWDQTMTILTDAAFNGHVGILGLIITTLRDLALRGKLPEDYYGRLVGKGSDNKLPALLWAAINGQLQALQYLCSIPEIKTSIRLIELDEVLEETIALYREEEKPNSFEAIHAILRVLRTELTPSLASKDKSVEPKVDTPTSSNKRQIKLLIEAIHNKELEQVEKLLTANPSIVLYKDLKKSILSEAACFGNPEIVQLIISRCPTDYDFGELLGEDEPTKLQSAILMSALACQFDILQYLLAIPCVFMTIAQRDIFSALKKIEDYLTGEMSRNELEKKYGWAIQKYDISRARYQVIYQFLNQLYYDKVAAAELPKSSRQLYLECSRPGRGTLLFTPAPRSAGQKRRIHTLTEQVSSEETMENFDIVDNLHR